MTVRKTKVAATKPVSFPQGTRVTHPEFGAGVVKGCVVVFDEPGRGYLSVRLHDVEKKLTIAPKKERLGQADKRLLKLFPEADLADFQDMLLLDCMLGKPELYDAAIIGIGERCGQPPVLIYSGEKLLEIDAKLPGGEDHDTLGSVTGAWMGEHTPIVLTSVPARKR